MELKKADLSITVIIAAAIGLIVLVVLIMIFSTTTGTTTKNINSCAAKDGDCAPQTGICPPENPIKIIVSGYCKDTTPNNDINTEGLCCIKST